MRQKFQGIFLVLTLLIGAASLPLTSASVGINQAYAVEVGAGVETEVGITVGSDDDSNSTDAKSETKVKGEAKMESETEMESKSEIQIQVHVSGDKATIEIEMNGEEKMYVLNTSSQAEIIAKIESETSLTESEIKSIWEYQEESDDEMKSSEMARMELETKIEAKIAGIANASIKSKERAKILVSYMEEQSDKTNERFHEILLKAKERGYLSSSENNASESYSINLDGSAQSQSKTSSSLQGVLYLESMKKGPNATNYKVSGGQILINGENYDILFGKARTTSSDAKVQSHMILIAEVMKPNGQVTTMKILMENQSSLNTQTETSSWSVMNPQSKIAGSWKMDAQATMTMA